MKGRVTAHTLEKKICLLYRSANKGLSLEDSLKKGRFETIKGFIDKAEISNETRLALLDHLDKFEPKKTGDILILCDQMIDTLRPRSYTTWIAKLGTGAVILTVLSAIANIVAVAEFLLPRPYIQLLLYTSIVLAGFCWLVSVLYQRRLITAGRGQLTLFIVGILPCVPFAWPHVVSIGQPAKPEKLKEVLNHASVQYFVNPVADLPEVVQLHRPDDRKVTSFLDITVEGLTDGTVNQDGTLEVSARSSSGAALRLNSVYLEEIEPKVNRNPKTKLVKVFLSLSADRKIAFLRRQSELRVASYLLHVEAVERGAKVRATKPVLVESRRDFSDQPSNENAVKLSSTAFFNEDGIRLHGVMKEGASVSLRDDRSRDRPGLWEFSFQIDTEKPTQEGLVKIVLACGIRIRLIPSDPSSRYFRAELESRESRRSLPGTISLKNFRLQPDSKGTFILRLYYDSHSVILSCGIGGQHSGPGVPVSEQLLQQSANNGVAGEFRDEFSIFGMNGVLLSRKQTVMPRVFLTNNSVKR